MRYPDRAELRRAAREAFSLTDAEQSTAAVLMIVQFADGEVVAGCTERDPGEIRGLMFRAGKTMPEEF